jgi:hypothetical protein
MPMTLAEKTLIYKAHMFDIFHVKGGLIHYVIRPDKSYGLADIQEYLESGKVIEKVYEGKFPTMTSVTGMLMIDKEGRDFMRDFKDSDRFILSNAVIVEKKYLRGMMNLLLTLVNQNKHPKMVFPSFEKGIQWIIQVNEEESWSDPQIGPEVLSKELSQFGRKKIRVE